MLYVWCVVVWCLGERGTFANVDFGGMFANVKKEVEVPYSLTISLTHT